MGTQAMPVPQDDPKTALIQQLRAELARLESSDNPAVRAAGSRLLDNLEGVEDDSGNLIQPGLVDFVGDENEFRRAFSDLYSQYQEASQGYNLNLPDRGRLGALGTGAVAGAVRSASPVIAALDAGIINPERSYEQSAQLIEQGARDFQGTTEHPYWAGAGNLAGYAAGTLGQMATGAGALRSAGATAARLSRPAAAAIERAARVAPTLSRAAPVIGASAGYDVLQAANPQTSIVGSLGEAGYDTRGFNPNSFADRLAGEFAGDVAAQGIAEVVKGGARGIRAGWNAATGTGSPQLSRILTTPVEDLLAPRVPDANMRPVGFNVGEEEAVTQVTNPARMLPPAEGGSASARRPFAVRAPTVAGAGALAAGAALASPSVAEAQSPQQSPLSPSSSEPRPFPRQRSLDEQARAYGWKPQEEEHNSGLLSLGLGVLAVGGGIHLARRFYGPAVMRRTPGVLSSSEQAVESLIDRPTLRESAQRGWRRAGRAVFQGAVRSQAGLENAERELIREIQRYNPSYRPRPGELSSIFAEEASYAGQRTRAALVGRGPVRYNELKQDYVPSGLPSLQSAISRLTPEEYTKLDPYMLAARLVELADGPRKLQLVTDAELAQMRTVIAEAPQSVRETADFISNKFLKFFLDEWAAAGGISQELALKLSDMYKFYLPLHKVLDEGLPLNLERRGGLGVKQQVQRLKGTHNEFMSPLEATIDYVSRMQQATEMIRPLQRLAGLGELAAIEAKRANQSLRTRSILRQVATPEMRGAKKEAAELLKVARSLGIDFTEDEAIEAAAGLSRGSGLGSDRVGVVWRNGKREFWEVSEEAAESLRALSPAQLGLATQILGLPAQVLKTGVTIAPPFQLFNLFRDAFAAISHSRFGFANPLQTIDALGRIYGTRLPFTRYIDKDYLDWRGGGGGVGISQASAHPLASMLANTPGRIGTWGRAHARARIVKQVTSKRSYDMIHFDMMSPIETLRDLVSPFEEATRYAAYRRAKRAGAPGLLARREGSEISTNFTMRGSSEMYARLTHIIPFLGPGIQSLWRDGNALKTQPKQILAVGGATVAGFSALMWALNRNDERVKELRDTKYGSAFWYMPLGDDPQAPILRMPKPFLLGAVFGTVTEQALDKLADENPMAADELMKALLTQAVPNYMPGFASVLGVGRTAEPLGTENLQREYRANADTPEVLKRFSATIPFISPGRADFIMRQLFGYMGEDALRIADRLMQGESEHPTRRPLIGSFYARYPSMSTASMQRYYQFRREATEANNTYQRLLRRNPQAVQGFLEKNESLLGDFIAVQFYDTKIGELQTALSQMEAQQLPPAEKERQRRQLFLEIQNIARQANSTIETLRRNREPR